jgi:hypothetical protein
MNAACFLRFPSLHSLDLSLSERLCAKARAANLHCLVSRPSRASSPEQADGTGEHWYRKRLNRAQEPISSGRLCTQPLRTPQQHEDHGHLATALRINQRPPSLEGAASKTPQNMSLQRHFFLRPFSLAFRSLDMKSGFLSDTQGAHLCRKTNLPRKNSLNS